MLRPQNQVRHVVAWLPATRLATLAVLWVVVAMSSLLPRLDVPLTGIWPLVLAAAICRTVLALRSGHEPLEGWRGTALVCDVVLLGGLLDITGGPYNPFVVMYGVYVWLAAVTLSPRWGLVVGVLASSGFGWLLLDHLQHANTDHHRLSDLPTHLFTMWMATGATIELVAHYVARADAALAQRQTLLDDARAHAAHSERLASLTTLAAGAAHELSTPLATIAVAARELERSLTGPASPLRVQPSLAEDARLIRQEVDRCQVILDSMSGRAGTGVHRDDPMPAIEIARLAGTRLSDGQRERLRVEVADGVSPPQVAGVEAAQALTSLLANAFDASGAAGNVLLRVTQRGTMVRMEVHDRGTGFTDEALRRAGEPFFTTKAPGRGLGLGLFLARALAERSGGTLRFERGDGTTVILEIPSAEVIA